MADRFCLLGNGPLVAETTTLQRQVVDSLYKLIDQYKAGMVDVQFWQVIGHSAMPTKLCSTYEQAQAVCREMGGQSFIVPAFC